MDLRVQLNTPEHYTLVGVTWWNFESAIGPFEIDVYLSPAIDEYIPRCIFRLGATDDQGQLHKYNSTAAPQRVIDQRPRQNRNWAVAVELRHLKA